MITDPATFEEYALGRKLTKAQVKRFIPNNLLTIDRQNEGAGKPSTKTHERAGCISRCVRPSFVYEKGNPHDRNHPRDRSGTSRT